MDLLISLESKSGEDQEKSRYHEEWDPRKIIIYFLHEVLFIVRS